MSAGPNYVLDKGFIANEAITQYYLVKLVAGSEATVDMNDTANEQTIGVAQEAATTAEAASGKVIDVRMLGVSTCVAAEAIAIGALVNANGAGKVKDLAGAVKQKVLGIALTTAAADGDQIDVFLTHGEVDNS